MINHNENDDENEKIDHRFLDMDTHILSNKVSQHDDPYT